MKNFEVVVIDKLFANLKVFIRQMGITMEKLNSLDENDLKLLKEIISKRVYYKWKNVEPLYDIPNIKKEDFMKYVNVILSKFLDDSDKDDFKTPLANASILIGRIVEKLST
jgi:hypothetical protein